MTSWNGNKFPRYWRFVRGIHWPFARGIHWSPVNSPHKGQWRGSLMFSLICTWTTGWVNNRYAGDLKHHRAHYDATVMDVGTVVVDHLVTAKQLTACPMGYSYPDNKVHGANMGPTWVLSAPRWAPCWPHEPCYLDSQTFCLWCLTARL